MSPKSNVPIRICGSKVRTGCRTCKARHLKCDERRPECLRCQKAKRQCVYEQQQSQFTQQRPAPDKGVELTVSVTTHQHNYFNFAEPSANLSLYGTREVADITAVKNFAARLGRQFAGSFSDDVWCDLFPRMAQYEPCVWDGIVAISTLDTSIRLTGNYDYTNPEIGTAGLRYGKALRELNTRLSSDQSVFCREAMLVSCILFAVFECLQSRYRSALFHISNGTKFLTEWASEAEADKRDDAGGYLSYASLEPIFLCLDTQAVQMGEVTFRNTLASRILDGRMKAPVAFSAPAEAHHLLNQIFNRMSRWTQWIEPCDVQGEKPGDKWMDEEQQSLRNQFSEWDAAFDASLGLMVYTPAILLLVIQRKAIQACFNKSNDGPSEMLWDNALPLFREIVQHAESYMKTSTNDSPGTSPSSDGSSSSSKSQPVLTIALDIVMPLWLVSAKCRHPDIRRRGLKMLKACDRREGIWDSNLCAQLVEKIIEIEEASALADGSIPDSARIYGIDVRLGDDREGEVKHKKHELRENGYEITAMHEETMVW